MRQKEKIFMNNSSAISSSSNDLVFPKFDNYLWLKILVGMVLGIGVGLVLSPHGLATVDAELSNVLASWIKLPGILFLGIIQMVVIPLVMCSIILGITQSGELSFIKTMGARVILYFVSTTVIAVTIGMSLTYIIQPGNFIDQSFIQNFNVEQVGIEDNASQKTFENLTIPERISNILPTNIVGAVVEKNLLQIVIGAMIFGIALLGIPRATAKPILRLCEAGQAVSMKIISWAMIIAPYAVFGLLCDITIKLGLDALASMGVYMAVVITGLMCMIFVYAMIATLIGKQNPIAFFKSIKETQLLAFSTSSSAATMPFTMSCAEGKLGVSPKVSRFVIPLGTTINMDGTALYQAVATIFLVQIFGDMSGVELSTFDLVLLIVTTVGASIGTPATPGVGIVVLATILTSIGLNPAAVGLILGVDRILDMCRTSVNVTGDLTASVVMNRFMKRNL
jgi:Na+/H+-dicarboxylate symporter